MQLTISSKFCA